MDQERERIQDDLRGLLDGEVRCDDVFVQMYASDASIYQIRPLGVVRPRHATDVASCVRYAFENGIPVHARGAGTGLAGEALGPGLVIDFSYAMRRITVLDEERVRVQPGVVHAHLNRSLAARGRIFGPDPATSSVSTMGSVLALDASGSRWLKYGSARRHVESLRVVLADGTLVEVSQHDVETARLTSPAILTDELAEPTPEQRRDIIVQRLTDLLERESQQITEHSRTTLVNTSGYYLDLLADGRLDLAQLIVGSEGTLGLVVDATLKTQKLPAYRGVALLFFERLDHAVQGALQAVKMGVSACDLMDRRLLTFAREEDRRFDQMIPDAAEAMLLVELMGNDQNELREQLQTLKSRLHRRRRLAFDVRYTMEDDETELYWELARQVIPRLYRLDGERRALPFIEDIAVPPEAVPDFLVQLQNVLKSHHVTASVFGHVGHGQLHIRPFLDLANDDDLRNMQALATDIYDEVLKLDGTVSGEHGDGLSRTWFGRRQFGPLYDVFREVKRILDPNNILNPGKVVADVPQPLTKNLRPVTAPVEPRDEADPPKNSEFELQLLWPEQDATYAARNCNGCGRCRTELLEHRMCPIFRTTPREEATPRAKANLVRAVLTGQMEASSLATEDIKQVADLCVNCHQCRVECPASVDVPKLMIEAKAQHVAAHGLSQVDWYLTHIDRIASWASFIRPLFNWSLGNRQMRWLIEKFFGIAQGRKLPRLARRSFMRIATRRRLHRPRRHESNKVVYFVDVYANWFDVQLAEALVEVLEHNGVAVYVPLGQRPSGISSISHGALDYAKKLAARNVEILAEAVRQGYHVVTTEPASAMCLTHEYPNLLDNDDTRLVAENTTEACQYLWGLHQEGQLELDLRPVNATVGYHLPCHLRAMSDDNAGSQLLRLIPGLSVENIEKGCSGMAGTFGLKRQNYRTSLRAGWGVISAIRDPKLHIGSTECAACKMQMEQGTAKPTIHPMKLLALAYGKRPDFAELLTARGEELRVT